MPAVFLVDTWRHPTCKEISQHRQHFPEEQSPALLSEPEPGRDCSNTGSGSPTERPPAAAALRSTSWPRRPAAACYGYTKSTAHRLVHSGCLTNLVPSHAWHFGKISVPAPDLKFQSSSSLPTIKFLTHLEIRVHDIPQLDDLNPMLDINVFMFFLILIYFLL